MTPNIASILSMAAECGIDMKQKETPVAFVQRHSTLSKIQRKKRKKLNKIKAASRKN
jgi:hypothetical protein